MVAFQTQQAVIQTPVLALPDFNAPFTIDMDASNSEMGMRIVIKQHAHHIAFISKPFGPGNQGLPAYERELPDILFATTKWNHFLRH
ncbi:hypothetical protein Nepgr_030476 [Nepenthes gracilis]|uniref:Reverse transcriptase/retrotransposon-derived protein RNase H-like domain-containing protein n=1 Tax=Nepenthes gracilis TaxID=150966 RepID=A0AAD3Y492_NEPGR|nr:hypothetical protein Nepgr_030476 [Nepenthes gracilis]